jgi:hypothetical protein
MSFKADDSQDSKQEKKRDPITLLLAMALIGLAGFFLYLGLDSGGANHQLFSKSTGQEAYQEAVNKHLKETYNDIKLKQTTTQLENIKEASRLKDTQPSETNLLTQEHEIQFGGDPRLAELPELMGRTQAPEPADNIDPSSLIQRRLFEDEQTQKYDRAFKEAYAAQYIQNALKKGWVVKINDDFQIVSIVPVKKRLPSLFDAKPSQPSRAK